MIIRAMREEEAHQVAAMVVGLARDIGSAVIPKLAGDSLLANRELVDIVVAEENGALLGACLTLITFSTWRAAKGLYVVDLFVESAARNRNTGYLLLREAARRGLKKGAAFIKLEVDHGNSAAARFYERIGFSRKADDGIFVLEQDALQSLVTDKERL